MSPDGAPPDRESARAPDPADREARRRRYVRSAAAVLKQVGDGVAVYVRPERALHVLNPTARALWEYLDEPARFDEIVRMLERLTDGRAETIAAELRQALDRFVELGIVERVE